MMGELQLKAILIIDLPQMCAECPMFTWASRDYKEGFCTHSHKLVKFDLRPLDCPLKPMPEKYIVHDITIETERDAAVCSHGITLGHNYVIEELEK